MRGNDKEGYIGLTTQSSMLNNIRRKEDEGRGKANFEFNAM